MISTPIPFSSLFLFLLAPVLGAAPTPPAPTNGGELLWVQRAGGSQGDYASDVACHTDGTVFVTGEFWGTALFPSTSGGTTGTSLTSQGEADAFLARYSASGNLLWARKIGGPYSDRGLQVELVSVGGTMRVQIRGTSFGKLRPYGPNDLLSYPPKEVNLSDESAFRCVYSLNGAPVSISYEAFDLFDPPSRKVEIAPAFGSLEAGWFDFALPLTGAPLTSAGGRDFYLAEMHPDPTPPAWSAAWALAGGGPGSDWATATTLATGESAIFVVGSFEQTATFPSLGGTPQSRTAADDDPNDAEERPDIFIAKYALSDCDADGAPDLQEGTCP